MGRMWWPKNVSLFVGVYFSFSPSGEEINILITLNYKVQTNYVESISIYYYLIGYTFTKVFNPFE
jgi:hypothetical protein